MILKILFLVLVNTNFVLNYKFSTKVPPKIGISSWITVENARDGRGEWEHGSISPLLVSGALTIDRTGNSTTLIISPHLDKIKLVCNATYPVRWHASETEFRPDEMYSYVYDVYETRFVKNVRDPTTFIFQSSLEVYGSISGVSRAFSCHSLIDPKVKKELYVFWEGNTFLTYGGELIEVKTLDNKTLILPCTITRPDVSVFLLKDTKNGEKELLRNSSIVYKPKIGFILNITELLDPFGRYRCISEDESDEDIERSVRINALHGFHDVNKKKELVFNETIGSNATFTYNETTNKFICCSSSSRAPNLKVVYCRDRITCRKKEDFLLKLVGTSKWSVNGSCTSYEIYRKNSGILRCRGDDVDIFKMYFTSILDPLTENETLKVYYSLEDAPKDELVNLIPSNYYLPIYAGQNFSAYCDASDFYFSKGLQWAIKYKNNSIHFLDDSNNPFMGEKYSYQKTVDFNSVIVIASLDMSSIICYAPVWNSTEWIKKEALINVAEAILPSVYMKNEAHHYTVNETGRIIKCRAEGQPTPYIHWRKDNRTLLMNNLNIKIVTTFENATSILNISRVSLMDQGEYSCTGINFAGEDQKHVFVYVAEPSNSSQIGLFVTISTLLCITLFGGILFLAWKLNLQKKVIAHLTGVAFRDANNHDK